MLSEQQVNEALPKEGWLTRYVEWASKSTDAPKAYHVGTGLALLSMAAPVEYGVPFGAATLRTNIYVLFVGDSRLARKTQSIKSGAKILRISMPLFIGEEPGSREGLEESIRSQPQQLIIYEEFGAFLAKVEEGYLMPIKTALTQIFDGGDLGRALASKRRGPIRNPRVSLLGGCAPEYLERHTEPVDWTGGFFSRFLVFNAARERTYTLPPGAAGADDIAAELLSIRSRKIGPCCGLDPSVRTFWDEYYLTQEAVAERAAKSTSGAAAGAPTTVIKVAGLIALYNENALVGRPWYIQRNTLEMAIKIVNLHTQSVMEIGDTLAESKDMRDRRTVLMQIDAVEPTPTSKIILGSRMTRKRVIEMLETLKAEETVRIVDGTKYVRNLREGERDARNQSRSRQVILSAQVPTIDDLLYAEGMKKVAEGKILDITGRVVTDLVMDDSPVTSTGESESTQPPTVIPSQEPRLVVVPTGAPAPYPPAGTSTALNLDDPNIVGASEYENDDADGYVQ